MDYETLRAFSGSVGLIIFVVLFVGVLVYALWPRNKSKFDHASRIPLDDDPAEEKPEGDPTDDKPSDNNISNRGGKRG